MTRFKSAILCASALVLCGTAQSLERNSYMGLDGKVARLSAKKVEGVYYKAQRYGVRPYLGFKLTDEVSVEVAHEWAAPLISRKTKEGVTVSSRATSALFSVAFEKKLFTIPDSKWFLAGGFAHTRLKICESGPGNNLIGYGKVTKTIPTAMLGIKRDFGGGFGARVFCDWKCTRKVRIQHAKNPNQSHLFNHTFGIGAGVVQEF